MTKLFVPPLPPRDPNWLPSWRALFGERMRSVVHGLPEPAFQVWHASGRLLNIRFHIVNRPGTIGKVLLERHANYLRLKQLQIGAELEPTTLKAVAVMIEQYRMPFRTAGQLLGITHQRVEQIFKSAKGAEVKNRQRLLAG